jgi:hypothetical protein
MHLGALAFLIAFCIPVSAEVVTAQGLSLDLPAGWVSVPEPSGEALRLRLPSNPMEIVVRADALPDMDAAALERFAKFSRENFARIHEEHVKRSGLTSSDMATSMARLGDGWRVTMVGRDNSPRQFAQLALISPRRTIVFYAQSINHGQSDLFKAIEELQARLRE